MVGTARAVMYHMLKGAGSGIDASGLRFDYTNGIPQIKIHEDQPVLRSAKQVWPIPTIFVINRKFTPSKVRLDKDGLPSVRYVWEFYKGICQCCLQKVSLREASRDHVVAKARGGWNDLSNIVLMHKDCNNKWADRFPKHNVLGEKIEPRFRVKPAHFMVPSNIDIREEWKPYLFLD